MYKLTRRKNLIWFLVTVVVCVAVSIFLPSYFPQQRLEMPAFVLYPTEIGLVIILSVLFFENASPAEQFRLAFTMLAMTMLSGSIANQINQTSQTLPDSLLLNWVQLVCMNITGLACTLTLYTTKVSEVAAYGGAAAKPAAAKAESTSESTDELAAIEKPEIVSGESAKDILDALDVSRINRLEKQITKQAEQKKEVSIESLFAEESQAASSAAETKAIGAAAEAPPAQPRRAASLDDLLSGDDIPVPDVAQAAPKVEVKAAAEPPKPAAEPQLIDASVQAVAEALDKEKPVFDLDFDMPVAPAEAPKAAAPAADVTSAAELVTDIDNLFDGIDFLAEKKEAVTAAALSEPSQPASPPPQPAVLEQPVASIEPQADLLNLFDDLGAPSVVAAAPSPAAEPAAVAPQPAPLPETVPPPAPAPAATPDPAADALSASLFDEGQLGGELDDIFSNLAPGVANDDVTPEKLASIKAQSSAAPDAAPAIEPAATAQPAPAIQPTVTAQPAPSVDAAPAPAASHGKLFDDALGSDIDSIFDNLAPDADKEVADLLNLDKPAAPSPAATTAPDVVPAAAPEKPAPAAPATSQASAPAPAPAPAAAQAQPEPAVKPAMTAGAGQASTGGKEVKEFGRLSAAATAKAELSAPGTLKTIGQMLLDTAAVENIIKRAESRSDELGKSTLTTAKVVTVSRGADIQQMLNKVAAFPGIDGSLVIGKDGLLIGATESLGMMRDVLGVLALGIHSTTGLGTKKVDLGELRQVILQTGEKLTVLTEIGIGVMACFSDHFKLDTIDAMMEHIRDVISESQATGSAAALPTDTLSGGMLGGAPSAVAQTASAPLSAQPAAAGQSAAAPAPAPASAAAAQPASPSPAPASTAAVQPADDVAVPIAEAKGGLFNVNDDDIGGLFDEILTDSTVHNDAIHGGGGSAKASATAAPQPAAASTSAQPAAASTSAQPAPATPAPQPAAQTAASEPGKSLLNVDDQLIGDLFDTLLDQSKAADPSLDFSPPGGVAAAASAPSTAVPAQAASAPAAAATAAAPAANTAPPAGSKASSSTTPPAAADKAAGGQQIKEFGRLSMSAVSKPGSDEGAIKAIGRQLIDVQAVENIIKAGEKREKMGSGLNTARVISAARGEGIKALLTRIDTCPGVAGSLIVGNDGLVIASTLQGGLDKDLLGALCTAMHSHSELALKKLEMGKLKQIIFHTPQKLTILTAVAVGVLAVFVDNQGAAGIDTLLGAIEQTVRG